jgi:hypothetical protein
MTQNHNCQKFKRLIVQRSFEKLSENDKKFLKQHCKCCPTCNHYLKSTESLKKALRHETLTPNPLIRRQLLNRIKQKNFEKGNSLGSSVHNLLSARIPLYQVVVTGLVIALLVISVYRFPTSLRDRRTFPYTEQSISVVSDSLRGVLNVIRHVDQDDLGRNIEEDSLFLQYVYTTM